MIAISQCPGIDPVKDSSAALQAALNLKQPIMWDCPVNCVMGTDASKSVFVPDGTDVTFTPQGRLDVDSFGFPALAHIHASAIWRGAKIRYVGSPTVAQPTSPNRWTDVVAKAYLAQAGITASQWTGPTNTSALVSVRGLSNVQFLGGKTYVDEGVTADKFAVGAFELGVARTVAGDLAYPSNFTMSNFEMDGVLMGIVGTAASVNLTSILRRRYADLQDAAGNNVGGVNYWFSPPHWIYLADSVAQPMKLTIKDAVDLAVYAGAPLRRSTGSGYINSIKTPLGSGSSIDGFYSRCVDGGIGVIGNGAATGGEIKNAYCIVDTSIRSIDGRSASTPGVFFPSAYAAYPVTKIDLTVHDLAGGNPVSGNPIPSTVSLDLRVQR